MTFLCLHGQPTWSYLYRRMLPVFIASGARVVAPDLCGFGRSDKPTDESWYTFTRHREALLAFVRHLDLRHVTLVCQDWGGILGLTLPMEAPDRYERLIVMNTILATGRLPLGDGFLAWRAWVNANPDLAVGRLMRRACPHLSEAEAAAYDAPFPSAEYKAGARRFPSLVCDHPDADGARVSRQAARWWQQEWRGQSFMAIGMQDVVIPPRRDALAPAGNSRLSVSPGAGRRRALRPGARRTSWRQRRWRTSVRTTSGRVEAMSRWTTGCALAERELGRASGGCSVAERLAGRQGFGRASREPVRRAAARPQNAMPSGHDERREASRGHDADEGGAGS